MLSEPTGSAKLNLFAIEVCPAAQVHLPRYIAGNTGGQRKALDVEAVDADIDIGNDWTVVIALPQFGQAQQCRTARGNTAYVDEVSKVSERPPVEPRFGDGQEYALRVGQFDVV